MKKTLYPLSPKGLMLSPLSPGSVISNVAGAIRSFRGSTSSCTFRRFLLGISLHQKPTYLLRRLQEVRQSMENAPCFRIVIELDISPNTMHDNHSRSRFDLQAL